MWRFQVRIADGSRPDWMCRSDANPRAGRIKIMQRTIATKPENPIQQG
jgi:hypothetical protein